MYSWKPYVETLPRERLRGLELKNFREILRYAKKSSPFYRDTFRGVEPEEVTTWDSLKALPLVDKEDLRQAQEGREPFPYGTLLGGEVEEVVAFLQTSGTTGRPVYVPVYSCSSVIQIAIFRHFCNKSK